MRRLFLVINMTGFRTTNGGRFLRTCATVCPESFHGGGKAHPDCESDVVVKVSQLRTGAHLSLLPACGYGVTATYAPAATASLPPYTIS